MREKKISPIAIFPFEYRKDGLTSDGFSYTQQNEG